MTTRTSKNSILHFTQWKLSLLFVLSICLASTSNAWANYSQHYNQNLELLIQSTPHKALKIASSNLAKALNDKEKLMALFYIAEAHDMLNQLAETNTTVKRGLALAKKTNNKRFIYEFTAFRIFEHELSGDFQKAFQLSNQNHQRAIELADDRLIGTSLTTRGQMYLNLSGHESALNDLEAALNIFQKNNDPVNTSNSFNTLAIIYADLNDFDKSIKFYKESLKSITTENFDQSTVFYNMGSVYVDLEQYDTALDYFQKTIDSATLVNDEYTVIFAQNGMADTYLKQKKFDEAIENYSNTIKLFEKIDDIQMLFNINLSLAEAYIGKKEFDNALHYLSITEQYSKHLENTLPKINILKTRESLYKAQNRWSDAYKALSESTALMDKLDQSSNESIIEELKVKYNARFDQEKMTHLQTQNALQENLILQGKIKYNYLSVIVGLVLFLLASTFYAYWIQKKQRKFLYELSTTDSLTQVNNRRFIVNYLKTLHSKRNQNKISYNVIMMDLDHFKKINDTYGHEIGNQVLIYFTSLLKKEIGMLGKIGRVGGEELLLVLLDIEKQDIIDLLNSIRAMYSQQKPKSIPDQCLLNFSSGILLKCEYYQDYDQILSDVDKALYKAKNSGRGKDHFINHNQTI